MRHRHGGFVPLLVAVLLVLAPLMAPAPASARTGSRSRRSPVATTPPGPPAPPPPPKAWILVDADTGNVIDAGDAHEPLQPASLTKVITALAVKAFIPADGSVPISARAQGEPAMSMSMKAGQVWPMQDAMHALLMISANDAAIALAERAAGSVEQFENVFAATAEALRMEDHPQLRDPAGLDDNEFSVAGGNLVSARDLSIAARALLADSTLSQIVSTPIYNFTGPDGVGHRLVNHNRLLSLYAGAIGAKTGYTMRAGPCLISAAKRDGRTMLAVVLHAPDMYGFSSALLDKGFATPIETESTTDRLPTVPGDLHAALTPAAHAPTTGIVPTDGATSGPLPHAAHRSSSIGALVGGGASPPLVAVEAVLIGAGCLRLRAVRRRRRRRPRHAAGG